MKKQVALMMEGALHDAACAHAKAIHLNFSQLVAQLLREAMEPKTDNSSQHVADLRQQIAEKQATIESLLRMLEQERQIRSVTDLSRSAPVGKQERRSATA